MVKSTFVYKPNANSADYYKLLANKFYLEADEKELFDFLCADCIKSMEDILDLDYFLAEIA